MSVLQNGFQSIEMVAGIGAFGLAMIAGAIIMLFRQPADPLSKLKKANRNAQRDAKRDAELRSKNTTRALDRFSGFLESKDTVERSEDRKKLLKAGFKSSDAVKWFNVAKLCFGILGIVGGYVYLFSLSDDAAIDGKTVALYLLLPGAIGYYAPIRWIHRKTLERQKHLLQSFPDFLDMMLVCVEAGQSFDQSVARVADEFQDTYPVLAEELHVINFELRAGKEKTSVLRDFADRCDIPDISSFVTVLIQSTQFGTNMGESLRVYAEEMRDKRVMRAEELANKLPTKMTLATMLLTVPPLLIILIGPSISGIAQLVGDG